MYSLRKLPGFKLAAVLQACANIPGNVREFVQHNPRDEYLTVFELPDEAALDYQYSLRRELESKKDYRELLRAFGAPFKDGHLHLSGIARVFFNFLRDAGLNPVVIVDLVGCNSTPVSLEIRVTVAIRYQ